VEDSVKLASLIKIMSIFFSVIRALSSFFCLTRPFAFHRRLWLVIEEVIT